MLINEGHWLSGDNVKVIPSHRSWYYANDLLRTEDHLPVGIMWHYSYTDASTAEVMAKKRIKSLQIAATEHRKANPHDPLLKSSSWHLSIEKDGELFQMVPFNRGAWHAGAGKLYAGPGVLKPVAPNRCLIGIELIGRGDHYPDEQIASAGELVRACVSAYGWTREQCIHEHRDFAPGRKPDCGEPWTSDCMPRVLEIAGFREDEIRE